AFPTEIPKKAIAPPTPEPKPVITLKVDRLTWADAIEGVGSTILDILILIRESGSELPLQIDGSSAELIGDLVNFTLPDGIAVGDAQVSLARIQQVLAPNPLSGVPEPKREIVESQPVR